VTARNLRLDPSSLTAAIALAVLAALANGVWILLDHSTPSWDQAHYLTTTLQYKDAFQIGGPIEMLHAIERADPSHGPLFTVLLLPALTIFGSSNSSGLLVNLVAAPILYLAAGQIAYIFFRSGFARLLAIFLVATTPILVGLLHNVLQDFLLVTLTTLSLLLLLESDGFRRRWITWAMALTMGLGTLTKVTFPLFVVGPLLVVVARVVYEAMSSRDTDGKDDLSLRPLLVNLGGAAIVYLAAAFVWYGPNFSETLDYVRSTTSGPLSEGAGPSDPFTFHALTSFTLKVVNFNLSWIIVLLGIAAALLAWPRLKRLFQPPISSEPLWKLAFLLAWVSVPFLSVALAHNQDVRLMAPAFPGVAVLVAGAITAIPRPQWRMALAAIAVVLLGYQTLNHMTTVTPDLLPDRARVALGSYEAAIPFSSEPIGYEQLPGDDYVTPIFDYIKQVASAEPGGASEHRTICLLESEPVININTLGFLSTVQGNPFGFVDVVKPLGTSDADLEEILSGCDFALYSRPSVAPPSDESRRETLVNEPYAANHMTPRMFRLFQGPSKVFPVVANPPVEGEPDFISIAAAGNGVRVLTRTASH
jgi:4-amino-4-deoxy-L-arabinose transferase-like glycosyltransferase